MIKKKIIYLIIMFRLTISLNLNHIYYQVNHLNGFQLKIFMNNKKKNFKINKVIIKYFKYI